MNSVITLTTDFGYADEYVGVMKGVIADKAPGARIIDLSHGIPPQGVKTCGYMLDAAWKYFPTGTIHVAVVDPGVGSERNIILAQVQGHFFLAPDNGLLTLILQNCQRSEIFKVASDHLYLQPVSHTFHGRDMFAPVAAALATGAQPDTIGEPISHQDIIHFSTALPSYNEENGHLTGTVVLIDHFGNAMTNISRTVAAKYFSAPAEQFILLPKNSSQIPVHDCYAAVPAGMPLALFGSRNFLEISVNKGNAAIQLDISIDDTVIMINKFII